MIMRHLQTYENFNIDELSLNGGYNFGGCNLFAIALHRITGYPLYTVRGYFKEEDWDIEEGYTLYDYEDAHVVVKLPNGNYLDADGEFSEQKLISLCNWSYPVKLGKTNEPGNFIEEIELLPITELEAFNIFYGSDEQDYIKDEDEQEVKEIIVKITIREFLNENQNSHLVEVIPNKYVYHTSNPIFRDKISKEGLIPKEKSEAWLSDTNINGEVIFVVNSDNKDDWWDSTYDDDVYQIDSTKLNNKWYNDPNFDSDGLHLITFENIPLNSIKLIYKGYN